MGKPQSSGGGLEVKGHTPNSPINLNLIFFLHNINCCLLV